MVDALVLGTSPFGGGGSSPLPGICLQTIKFHSRGLEVNPAGE